MKHASMNRIYRLVWNTALGLWVAVAENAKGASKGGSARRAVLTLASVLSLLSPLAHAADAANAAVTAGTGSVSTAGAVTTINQSSNRMAVDWTKLSTTANEALVFKQPGASSIALNRVTGSDPTQLLGSLSANGQVFILNPNGVMFGAGSQVNVGGLVASTLSLSNEDFMAGKLSFANNGASGTILNQGTLTAGEGGYLALLGPQVRNEGVMTARLGTALMAAGNKVTLNLNNGSLVGYSIDQGAVNALADNGGLIKADGGQVLLTATALDALATATVNNTGVIEAQTVENKSGRIILLGDKQYGTTMVGGTLDASAPNGGDGGFIEASAANVRINEEAKITTLAYTGNTGSFLIDPSTFTVSDGTAPPNTATDSYISNTNLQTQLGTSNVILQTDSGSGLITVKGALTWASDKTLKLLAGGTTGNIVIEKMIRFNNGGLTLSAKGDISRTDPASAPLIGNVLILENGNWRQTGLQPFGPPDIEVTDFRITGGTFLHAGTGDGSVAAPYQILDVYGLQGIGSAGMLNQNYILTNGIDATGTQNWNNVAGVKAGFKPIGTASTPFTGSLDGLPDNRSPFGTYSVQGLTINRPSEDNVGIFGAVSSTGVLSEVNVNASSIIGRDNVGGLAGSNGGRITDSFVAGIATGRTNVGGLVGSNHDQASIRGVSIGTVTGADAVGGLVGLNDGSTISAGSNSFADATATGGTAGGLVGVSRNVSTITGSYARGNAIAAIAGGLVGSSTNSSIQNSYATGNVTGNGAINGASGGLVGNNASFSTITGSYATGSVNGTSSTGGLVGMNQGNSSIQGSYASGPVTGSAGLTGGLVGLNTSGASIAASYATGNVSGQSNVGGLAGSNTTGATISGSYATGSVVASQSSAGGLAGANSGGSSIQDSYASGSVSSSFGSAGGLLGFNDATVSRTYSTGAVSGATPGGLVGSSGGSSAITASYWNTETSGQATSAGGTGVSSGGMMQASTFQGWDLATTGGTTKTWRIYEGYTAPLLRGFLTPFTLGDVTTTYDAQSHSAVAASDPKVLGSAATATNAGTYNGYYSTQTGYDITGGNLLINKFVINVTGTRVYNQSTAFQAADLSLGTLVNNETLTLTGTGQVPDKNVGVKTLDVTGLALSDGTGLASNYTFVTGAHSVTITKADLTVAAQGAAKTYDSGTAAAVMLSGGFTGDDLSFSGTGTFVSKNAGPSVGINVTGISVGGNDAGNYNLLNTTATTSADIYKADMTVSAVGVAKTYNGNRAATATLSGGFAGDDLSFASTATFASKNAGTNVPISVTGITVGGADAANYNVLNTAASTSADITKADLTVAALGVAKTYDRTTAATVTLSGGVPSDDLTYSGTAVFVSKNAGASVPINVTGITVTGADVVNYNVLNTTATTSADILKAGLTATATGIPKTYDGTTQASVTYGSNPLAGDTVSLTGSASFVSPNAAPSVTINVRDITVGGADANNYKLLNTTATTSAAITPKAVVVDSGGTVSGPGGATLTPAEIISGNYVFSDTSGLAVAASSLLTADKPIMPNLITLYGCDYQALTGLGGAVANSGAGCGSVSRSDGIEVRVLERPEGNNR